MKRVVLCIFAFSLLSCNSSGAKNYSETTDGSAISNVEWIECDAYSVPANDLSNCGACGHDCLALPHVSSDVQCVAGACVLTDGSCTPGWANCSGDPEDGCNIDITLAETCGACDKSCSDPTMPFCAPNDASQLAFSCVAACPMHAPVDCGSSCVDLATSTNHCGQCGVTCPETASDLPICEEGICYTTCKMGFHVCSYTCVSNRSVTACGELSCEPCQAPAHALPQCDGISCSYACASGYLLCDGQCIANDENNCGTCGNKCPTIPNVEVGYGYTCKADVCVPLATLTCAPGYGHCTDKINDGCETSLADPNNCGACGKKCPKDAPLCAKKAGSTKGKPVYVCSTGCDPDAPVLCGGSCVNTADDPSNCGACGNSCGVKGNVKVACVKGVCDYQCPKGNHFCFDQCVSNTSPKTCGTSCDSPCAPNQSCSDQGKCVCDAKSCPTGCCDTNEKCITTPSITTCGTGGQDCVACSLKNATASCSDGKCQVEECTAGKGNCDINDSNGCETPVDTLTDCGQCGKKCPSAPNATPSCADGECIYTCTGSYQDCDQNMSNGCESNPNSDVSNCGSCGNSCDRPENTNSAVCKSGKCGYDICSIGYSDCNRNASDGCEVKTGGDDLENCGVCGIKCDPPNVNQAVCRFGICAFTGGCVDGFADCSSLFPGCETQLGSTAHCGSCDACLDGQACINYLCEGTPSSS